MKQHPPFNDNSFGACVPYAVSNAMHFVKNEKGQPMAEEMLKYYPENKDGYMIGEVDTMLKLIDPDGRLLANILHFNRAITLTKADFFDSSKLWHLSEHIKAEFNSEEYFTIFLFFIYDNDVRHAVSGFISLDNFAMVLMDSKGKGSVEIIELEKFFALFEVYGVLQVGVELDNGARIPYIIERDTIELWK